MIVEHQLGSPSPPGLSLGILAKADYLHHLQMGFLTSLVSSKERDVEHSDSGSDDLVSPAGRLGHLRSVYPGMIVNSITQTAHPEHRGIASSFRQHM